MKLGIITFHSAINYGAVLQTYALQEKCKEYTHNSYVINYCPKYIDGNYSFIPLNYDVKGNKILKISQLKRLINNIYNMKTFSVKKKKIQGFVKNNLNLTSKIICRNEMEKLDLDYVICGSDQIWNPEIANGLDKMYFGNINNYKEPVRIAYAASIGKSEIDNKYINEFSTLMKGMKHISVREKNSIKSLNILSDVEIQNVLDPTLLVDCKVWDKFITKKISRENYLLIYKMENNPYIDELANKISKELNLKIIEIGSKNVKYKVSHELKCDLGIEEFLSYFYNAEFILTNSFHGTAFSVIFNKSFYSILHSTLGLRIKDLLEDLELKDRIIDPENENLEYKDFNSINWKKSNLLLDNLKKKSNDFIKDALSEEE